MSAFASAQSDQFNCVSPAKLFDAVSHGEYYSKLSETRF